MNKLTPKNKICFQNNGNIRINLKLKNLRSKKWNIFKKKIKYKKEIKPEQRKKFYQKRLFEFQLFKNYYGLISNSKIKRLFKQINSRKKKKNVFKTFILTLERRLDMTLIRFKFTNSIFKAKQLINHKKVKINNKVINKPNFQLKIGDIITIQKKKRKMKKFTKRKFYKKNFNFKYKYKNYNSKYTTNQKEQKFLFFGQNLTKTELKNHVKIKTKYFYKVKKQKKGVLLNLPLFNNLKYPYPFNFKLINEMLKK